jgi:hypothetical protein
MVLSIFSSPLLDFLVPALPVERRQRKKKFFLKITLPWANQVAPEKPAHNGDFWVQSPSSHDTK